MGAKIQVVEGTRTIGSMTLFDMVPSFALIKAVLPDAKMIAHDFRSGKWFVDLGEQLPPALADKMQRRSELQKQASRENGRMGGRPRTHWCNVCLKFHKLPLCARRRKTQRSQGFAPAENRSLRS